MQISHRYISNQQNQLVIRIRTLMFQKYIYEMADAVIAGSY